MSLGDGTREGGQSFQVQNTGHFLWQHSGSIDVCPWYDATELNGALDSTSLVHIVSGQIEFEENTFRRKQAIKVVSYTRLLAIPTLRGHEMHTNVRCIFILDQVMKQWLSQMSLFWGLGHTISEQCSKMPSFPLLEADNWWDKFHPGGYKDMW